MTSEGKILLFQDLLLRGPPSDHAALRDALIKAALGPWQHSSEWERYLPRTGMDAEVIAFEREGSGGVDAVRLTLWPHEEGFKVTNIVPREVRGLGEHRYNVALRDFIDRVAQPAAEQVGFMVEVSSAEQGLENWLPTEAAKALRHFSESANKSTGSSHPLDRERWFAFLFAVHRAQSDFDTSKLTRWMTETEGWPEDIAHDLAIQYEFGLDLLGEYDRNRP